jgi:hypothetical protein
LFLFQVFHESCTESKWTFLQVTNFHKACTESKCFNFTLDNYVPEIPHNMPQQTTTYDYFIFDLFCFVFWSITSLFISPSLSLISFQVWFWCFLIPLHGTLGWTGIQDVWVCKFLSLRGTVFHRLYLCSLLFKFSMYVYFCRLWLAKFGKLWHTHLFHRRWMIWLQKWRVSRSKDFR